jgi:hypothetical protein
VGVTLIGASPQFSKISVRKSSWTEVQWPAFAHQRAFLRGCATVYSVLLPGFSEACRSTGSLKYMHHFGLESFFKAGEHWVLQASLPHSISDELFVTSFAFALDASALADTGL